MPGIFQWGAISVQENGQATTKPLLDFVKNVAAHGPKGDLFGDAGDMPEEFRQLMATRSPPELQACKIP